MCDEVTTTTGNVLWSTLFDLRGCNLIAISSFTGTPLYWRQTAPQTHRKMESWFQKRPVDPLRQNIIDVTFTCPFCLESNLCNYEKFLDHVENIHGSSGGSPSCLGYQTDFFEGKGQHQAFNVPSPNEASLTLLITSAYKIGSVEQVVLCPHCKHVELTEDALFHHLDTGNSD